MFVIPQAGVPGERTCSLGWERSASAFAVVFVVALAFLVVVPQAGAPGAHIRSMTSKQVAFHDYNGREAVVTLH